MSLSVGNLTLLDRMAVLPFALGGKNSESTKGRKTLRGMDDLATKLPSVLQNLRFAIR
jgi:hypothetical protein